MEENVVEKRPRSVECRFELAASRIIDACLAAGSVQVTAADIKLAEEYLEQAGWIIQRLIGARVRMVNRQGRAQEVTREALVMMALRSLAHRE